ncbi:MAG: hypothetical protein KAX24_12580 [Anaerolineae bacterium]|nr:hypothetical protein [Anaerolineae bacterium]
MPQDPNTAKITVIMPRELRDAARAKAKVLRTSLSEVLRGHLREWVTEPLPVLMSWAENPDD